MSFGDFADATDVGFEVIQAHVKPVEHIEEVLLQYELFSGEVEHASSGLELAKVLEARADRFGDLDEMFLRVQRAVSRVLSFGKSCTRTCSSSIVSQASCNALELSSTKR